MEEYQINLEAQILEQEHRLVKVILNVINIKKYEKDDPRRSAVIKAFVLYFFSARTIFVTSGLGVGIFSAYFLWQQNQLIEKQSAELRNNSELLARQAAYRRRTELTVLLEETSDSEGFEFPYDDRVKNKYSSKVIKSAVLELLSLEREKVVSAGILDCDQGGQPISLSGILLDGVRFKDTCLDNIDFSGSFITNSFFENVSFVGSSFKGAIIHNSHFFNVKYDEKSFKYSNWAGSYPERSQLFLPNRVSIYFLPEEVENDAMFQAVFARIFFKKSRNSLNSLFIPGLNFEACERLFEHKKYLVRTSDNSIIISSNKFQLTNNGCKENPLYSLFKMDIGIEAKLLSSESYISFNDKLVNEIDRVLPMVSNISVEKQKEFVSKFSFAEGTQVRYEKPFDMEDDAQPKSFVMSGSELIKYGQNKVMVVFKPWLLNDSRNGFEYAKSIAKHTCTKNGKQARMDYAISLIGEEDGGEIVKDRDGNWLDAIGILFDCI